jgi:glycosyltransferase involved in cell wall biosynthesis
VFVLPSHFEGFPNVLVEAMSYGCACISYDCDTGPREIIVNSENGVLVRKVGDVTDLTAAISGVLEDAALRERISRNAVAVRERYSMRKIQEKWDALITTRRPAGTF